MADLDNVIPAGDDEDDLLSDLRAAFKGEEAEAPVADEPVAEAEAEEAPSDSDRVRDEKGRFAPKAIKADEPVAEAAPVEEQPAPEAAAPETGTQENAPLRPPPGWSPAAKVAFNELPAEVKQAVANREVEVNNGLAKLASYRPVDPFLDMCRQNGADPAHVLSQYTGIEAELKRDFLSGIGVLCQNARIDPVSLAQAILARSGAAPQQADTGHQQGAQTPSADLQPVMQELHQLKSYIATQQQAQVQSEIQAFEADPANVFFANVRPQMAQLMQTGAARTLKEAYETACWTDPAIRTLLIKQQSGAPAKVAQQAAAATQARAAAKSVTGSPSPGASAQKAALPDIEDEIRAAYRAAKV